jgi:ectonucleotide pyrophosphatase/phosphodiesterase family protein 5
MHSTFWNAEPIWNTNQAQGGESAVLHYPGSDVEIKGRRPSHYVPFTDQISSKERVKLMQSWLEENPLVNLAVLYFDEVDHAGHLYGPDSREVNKALKSVDRAIGDFVAWIKRKGLHDEYNIVLVSDHGMTKAVDGKRIVLDKVVPNLGKMLQWSDFGPVTSMIPKPEYRHRLGIELKRAIRKHRLPVRLLTKSSMPAAYHYSRNERIPPYVLEAKKGSTIDVSSMEWHPRGLHGYGDSVRDMDGIFIANGPAFRKNPLPSYPFHSNLDVYPLMCQLLGIEPKPNNGTFELGMHSMFSPRQLF